MQKLRKNLPQSNSILIFPTDEAIDWKKTALKITEDVEYFSILKQFTYPDESDEVVKDKFVKTASKLMIYDYYKSHGFDSDILVSREDVPVLKYVIKDFNITDLDIIAENSDNLGILFNSIKDKSLTQKELTNTLMELLKNKDLSTIVKKVISTILEAKLVKVIGVDSDVSREEIIKETVESLQFQDIAALFSFVQSSIKLNLEKKNISQS